MYLMSCQGNKVFDCLWYGLPKESDLDCAYFLAFMFNSEIHLDTSHTQVAFVNDTYIPIKVHPVTHNSFYKTT